MATNIGNLFVNFGVNATGFVKGTDKATKKLTQFQKHVQKVDKSLKLLKFGLAGFAGGIGARSILGSFSKTIDELDRLGEISDKLKIGSDKLAGLTFAAEQNQASAEAMIGALEILPVKAAQAAAGMTKIKKVFDALNVDASTLLQLSPDQMFSRMSDAIAKVKTQAERLRFAKVLFGGAGSSLLPLLEQGAAGIRDMQKRAEELGIAVERGAIDKFDALKDSINESKKAWEGFKISLLQTGIVDVLTNATKAISEAVQGARLIREQARPPKQRTWGGFFADWAAASLALPFNVVGQGMAAERTAIDRFLINRGVAMDRAAPRAMTEAERRNRLPHRGGFDEVDDMLEKMRARDLATAETNKINAAVMEWGKQRLANLAEPWIEMGTKLAQKTGRGILAGMNAALIWNLFQRPFTRGLPQRPPEKEPEFSSAKGLELLQRGTPEAAMASYRFRLMQNSIPKKQLDQAVIANKHLNNVERNTRKQAEIEVFEVGIL